MITHALQPQVNTTDDPPFYFLGLPTLLRATSNLSAVDRLAKASPTTTMIARFLAVDDAGGERLLGEYTFHHTRTIPGPPGWEMP